MSSSLSILILYFISESRVYVGYLLLYVRTFLLHCGALFAWLPSQPQYYWPAHHATILAA